MKKIILIFIFVVSVFFIANVNAEVKENAFTSESCIDTTEWQNSAVTAYSVNQKDETFEVSGQSYEEVVAQNKTDVHVFYMALEDQKELYAFIPNYSTLVSTDAGASELDRLGIITTEDCAKTLVVKKTLVGINEYAGTEEATNQSNSTSSENNTSDSTNGEAKIFTPDTASVINIVAIVAGILLIACGLYLVITKNNKNKPSIFIIGFLLITIPFGVKAAAINTPTITEFEPTENEANALTIKWKTNNNGKKYTTEIYNYTLGIVNRFSNSVGEYTYQELTADNPYKVAIRSCLKENKEYKCSNWSDITQAEPSELKKIKKSNFTTSKMSDESLKEATDTTAADKQSRQITNANVEVDSSKISGMSISPATQFAEEQEQQLYVNFTPADASTGVNWTVTDPNVLSIDAEGKMTGLRAGTTIVTGTVGQYSDSVEVTVVPKGSVALDRNSLSIGSGQTGQIKVVGNPTTLSSSETQWTSSNPSVATVTPTGAQAEVTGVSQGTAVITAKLGDVQSTINVSVNLNVPLTGITLDQSETITMYNNETKTIKVASYTPSNHTNSTKINWKSSNTNIVSFVNYTAGNASVTLKANKTGTTTVTATSVANPNIKKTITVQVLEKSIPITSIKTNYTDVKVRQGNKLVLKVTDYSPSNATDSKTPSCTGGSSKIATVTPKCTVSALNPGSTTVTMSVGSKPVTQKVKVTVICRSGYSNKNGKCVQNQSNTNPTPSTTPDTKNSDAYDAGQGCSVEYCKKWYGQGYTKAYGSCSCVKINCRSGEKWTTAGCVVDPDMQRAFQCNNKTGYFWDNVRKECRRKDLSNELLNNR